MTMHIQHVAEQAKLNQVVAKAERTAVVAKEGSPEESAVVNDHAHTSVLSRLASREMLLAKQMELDATDKVERFRQADTVGARSISDEAINKILARMLEFQTAR